MNPQNLTLCESEPLLDPIKRAETTLLQSLTTLLQSRVEDFIKSSLAGEDLGIEVKEEYIVSLLNDVQSTRRRIESLR